MKVLFDHNVDRRFRKHIPGHDIKTTREMGWEQLGNGELLKCAATSRFEAFVSLDKKLEYEQNLKTLPLPVVVIDSQSNALPDLLPFAPFIIQLLGASIDQVLHVIQADGAVIRLSSPRP